MAAGWVVSIDLCLVLWHQTSPRSESCMDDLVKFPKENLVSSFTHHKRNCIDLCLTIVESHGNVSCCITHGSCLSPVVDTTVNTRQILLFSTNIMSLGVCLFSALLLCVVAAVSAASVKVDPSSVSIKPRPRPICCK